MYRTAVHLQTMSTGSVHCHLSDSYLWLDWLTYAIFKLIANHVLVSAGIFCISIFLVRDSEAFQPISKTGFIKAYQIFILPSYKFCNLNMIYIIHLIVSNMLLILIKKMNDDLSNGNDNS